MNENRTNCLTYGHTTTFGGALKYSGKRIPYVADFPADTLCGREDATPMQTDYDANQPRPVHVCRACWRKYMADNGVVLNNEEQS